MMTGTTPSTRAAPELPRSDDHEAIERALEQIVRAVASNAAPAPMAELWTSFVGMLGEHFRIEEEVLFVRVDARHRFDLLRLWEDHTALREMLDRMTADVERGDLRLDTVKAFVQSLRDHATIEDRSAYMWASWDLPG